MSEQLPTCGQLERSLSQRIQALYRKNLGHQPSKILCQLFEQKIAIVIEDSLTSTEQLLAKDGQEKLVQEVRSSLDEVIKPQIIRLVETIAQVKVMDLLSDANLDTGRTGIIVVLGETPKVRNPEAIAKTNSSSSSSTHYC